MKAITRYLGVKGTLWCGDKSMYNYNLSYNQNPKTLAEASKIAVDFRSLTEATIHTVTSTVTRKIGKTITK